MADFEQELGDKLSGEADAIAGVFRDFSRELAARFDQVLVPVRNKRGEIDESKAPIDTALFGFADAVRNESGALEGVDVTLGRIHKRFKELRKEALEAKTAVDFFGVGASQVLGRSLTGTAEGLADAFADLGKTGKLSMSTIGEAVRKAVGVQLQEIGALALTRSLFELASGFATLFLNPAESAGHFQAAALFAAIGTGAAVAGGAIAGGAAPSGSNGRIAAEGQIDAEDTRPRGSLEINITNHGTLTENVGDIIVESIRNAVDDDRLVLRSDAGRISAA